MQKKSHERKTEMKPSKLQRIIVLALIACMILSVSCGKKEEEPVSSPSESTAPVSQSPQPSPSPQPSETPKPTPSPSPAPVVSTSPEPVDTQDDAEPILDQYYLNDKLMMEMLVNDDVMIQEIDSGLFINTDSEKTMLLIMFKPGIQNLEASGLIARTAVSTSFTNAQASELLDGSLFGSRAKYCEFTADSDEGGTIYGIAASTIANQSFYNVLVAFEEDAPAYEMQLIVSVFGTINILKPTTVNQTAKTAIYNSVYQEQLNSRQITQSPAVSSQKPVSDWSYLPYDFYSWWGDPGDYGMYPSWVYEPDWDFYSDPGDYWDWGWDDYSDWWFYDEYGDYYDYDYYQYFDDYWDDYDPWSDYGDYYDDWWSDYDDWDYDEWDDWDYDPWSDSGDWDYDPWSDYGDDDWSDYGDYDDDW
jgi:DNA-directed RNA polymerase subunit beta'